MGKIKGFGDGVELPLSTVQSDPQVRAYSHGNCTVLGRKVRTRLSTVQSPPQVRVYSTWSCTEARGDLTPVFAAFRAVFALSPLEMGGD